MKDEKSRLSSVKQQTPFVLTWGRAIQWINHHNDGLGKPNALERFSFEYRKTKTKVITLANHKGHRQYSEPIKTRSNYM